jgi:hypothetical protein
MIFSIALDATALITIHKNKMNAYKIHVVEALYSSFKAWDGST